MRVWVEPGPPPGTRSATFGYGDRRGRLGPPPRRKDNHMKSKELRGWIDHRAQMLWVCMKSLVLMIVGVAVAVSLDGLSDDASVALSVAVGLIGFFLWFAAFGAVMDIATMRKDMDDSLRSTAFGMNFEKAPFPVYFVLMTVSMLGSTALLIVMLNA